MISKSFLFLLLIGLYSSSLAQHIKQEIFLRRENANFDHLAVCLPGQKWKVNNCLAECLMRDGVSLDTVVRYSEDTFVSEFHSS